MVEAGHSIVQAEVQEQAFHAAVQAGVGVGVYPDHQERLGLDHQENCSLEKGPAVSRQRPRQPCRRTTPTPADPYVSLSYLSEELRVTTRYEAHL